MKKQSLFMRLATGTFAIVLLVGCQAAPLPDMEQTYNSQSTPQPAPEIQTVEGAPYFAQDFSDVIPAVPGSIYYSQAQVAGYEGSMEVVVSGFDAQISADNLTWSNQISLLNGGTIYIRMTASSAQEARFAVVTIGSVSENWGVSTEKIVTEFSAPGTYTYTRPAVGRYVKAECWGAGGGGGVGAGTGWGGGGGGGGGYFVKTVPVSLLNASESVVVGAGGAGATSSYQRAANGGASSFGAHAAAGGGQGGEGASLSQTGGSGGIAESGNGSAGQKGSTNGGAGGAAFQGGLGGSGGANGYSGHGGEGQPGQPGCFPGGGGGASGGGGNGGQFGNGGPQGGTGAHGHCIVTIIP